MKEFVLCVAAVFAMLCGSDFTSVCAENVDEILCETVAVLDDTGEPVRVTVTGRRFAPDSGYFTHIRVHLDGVKEIIPETDDGYGAGVAAFDFKGDGYCQLFYYASSGGSGGYGYFYVFDCSEEIPTTVFDYKNFKNEYKAECDGKSVLVYRGGELFVTYDLSQKGMIGGNDIICTDGEAYVTDLNFVEPVFVYSLNYYRLNVWQNVIAGAQVNVVGRIITTMVYDKEFGRFKSGFASVSGSG